MKIVFSIILCVLSLTSQAFAGNHSNLKKEDVNRGNLPNVSFELRCAATKTGDNFVSSRTWEIYLKNRNENGHMIQTMILARHDVMDDYIAKSNIKDFPSDYFTSMKEFNTSNLNDFGRTYVLTYDQFNKNGRYMAAYLTFDIYDHSLIYTDFDAENGIVLKNRSLYFPNCM